MTPCNRHYRTLHSESDQQFCLAQVIATASCYPNSRKLCRNGTRVAEEPLPQMAVIFDPRKTMGIHPLVMQCSSAPIAGLLDLLGPGYRYGYIGTEDRMMYPLIIPG